MITAARIREFKIESDGRIVIEEAHGKASLIEGRSRNPGQSPSIVRTGSDNLRHPPWQKPRKAGQEQSDEGGSTQPHQVPKVVPNHTATGETLTPASR
jgi:hypothetical protein